MVLNAPIVPHTQPLRLDQRNSSRRVVRERAAPEPRQDDPPDGRSLPQNVRAEVASIVEDAGTHATWGADALAGSVAEIPAGLRATSRAHRMLRISETFRKSKKNSTTTPNAMQPRKSHHPGQKPRAWIESEIP
jgi:hypothetical protein